MGEAAQVEKSKGQEATKRVRISEPSAWVLAYVASFRHGPVTGDLPVEAVAELERAGLVAACEVAPLTPVQRHRLTVAGANRICAWPERMGAVFLAGGFWLISHHKQKHLDVQGSVIVVVGPPFGGRVPSATVDEWRIAASESYATHLAPQKG